MSSLRALTIVLLQLLSTQALANHLPLWELGIGFGGLAAPDYRGAKNYSFFAAPFPYGRYRGESFQIDDGGVRQKLFSTSRVKLDLSLAGNIPVRNHHNPRVDMPKLDPLGEIGPSLHFRMWPEQAGSTQSLWLVNPVRAVFSSDFKSLQSRGWTYSPYVEYYQRWNPVRRAYTLSVVGGPIWGSGEYHRYFYEVAPQYATPDRPQYRATEGYSGSHVSINFAGISRKAWAGLFVRYDTLNAAVFADSPLVETQNYLVGGVVVGYLFFGSDARATHHR
ncbi:MAG: MipA/OmpV family protein [Gammaproteobacteria bacterium]|nr:MipA/OmpV family protein [Gammaproteobacteria bacterium]